MMNAEPHPGQPSDARDEDIDAVVASGAGGALLLSGVAVGIVFLLWLAFYLLIFVPRSMPS